MKFSITPRDGYLEVKFTGRPTPDGFARYCDALVHHKDWKPGSLVLTDDTDLDASSITVGEVRAIAEVLGRYRKEHGKARTAIVAPRDLVYGMIRMWGVFIEGKWDVETMVFRSRDEALAWLLA